MSRGHHGTMTILRRFKTILALAVAAAVLLTVPRMWCGREAGRLLDGTSPALARLTRHVQQVVGGGVSATDFNPGSAFFDGEWVFGNCQTAGLGMAQVALTRPEVRASLVPTRLTFRLLRALLGLRAAGRRLPLEDLGDLGLPKLDRLEPDHFPVPGDEVGGRALQTPSQAVVDVGHDGPPGASLPAHFSRALTSSPTCLPNCNSLDLLNKARLGNSNASYGQYLFCSAAQRAW